MAKSNLPNIIGGVNYVSEYAKYSDIYMDLNRTQSGTATFTSTSSGTAYSTSDYPTDVDVYNKGEEGLATLLYKYVLKDFIVDQDYTDYIEGVVSSISNKQTVYDVVVSYASGVYTVESGLPSTLPTGTYTIRFVPGVACAADDMIRLSSSETSYNIKMLDGNNVKINTWASTAVVELIVKGTLIQLSGGGGSGGGWTAASTAPTDTTLLWVDTANNNIMKFYDSTSSSWKPIVGTFGSAS